MDEGGGGNGGGAEGASGRRMRGTVVLEGAGGMGEVDVSLRCLWGSGGWKGVPDELGGGWSLGAWSLWRVVKNQ